ncbi:hypothetical protein KZJ38_04045 [Paraburkholderia edwinii]|uniref:Uncharacterized protein n=1 Tax=Paraburkholderia edwinii TaxID=2861782 RepID=A0ABX8UL15_9BURK|nr:hypothetical protein [Paraburkholderia edwinii]QYD69544.1 hypothetical protein KZJ38_04045 [Paraburkholderia edwinii]
MLSFFGVPSGPSFRTFYEDTGLSFFAAAGTARRDGRFGTTTQLMTNQMRADERLHHACCDHWLVPFFEMAEAST